MSSKYKAKERVFVRSGPYHDVLGHVLRQSARTSAVTVRIEFLGKPRDVSVMPYELRRSVIDAQPEAKAKKKGTRK